MCLERRSKVSCPSWFTESFSSLLPSWSSFLDSILFHCGCRNRPGAEALLVLQPRAAESGEWPAHPHPQQGRLRLVAGRTAGLVLSPLLCSFANFAFEPLLTLSKNNLQARGKKRQKGWFSSSHVKILGSNSGKSTPAPPPGKVAQKQNSGVIDGRAELKAPPTLPQCAR